MSIVTLQLGQCGNQLGYALFDKLATELEAPLEMDIFFRGPSSTARAVLIDMEPKVGDGPSETRASIPTGA
ncbi:hypothetical protein SPRG_17885 [Saprolegnia parasitica CBS 223.65]|uniref:Uncharacterized protein n=1 Tax=Saprolegnia parasitica (strain CBS 223.65) TaxID=695850 RepID=A0A067BQL8_SAPPC|nr:hypothetical protein SPRG_17885 [Saprolegnia parasitica CBS 223.65]KDO16606.1 hypothetical protein SPRG_17885 [Saprolegnia parasitica CBS 223.65]|eukprot:XP_012212684.1 hypothetical protein SPRG_17885 [Saprolegnia parasitica CBS 223.65]